MTLSWWLRREIISVTLHYMLSGIVIRFCILLLIGWQSRSAGDHRHPASVCDAWHREIARLVQNRDHLHREWHRRKSRQRHLLTISRRSWFLFIALDVGYLTYARIHNHHSALELTWWGTTMNSGLNVFASRREDKAWQTMRNNSFNT